MFGIDKQNVTLTSVLSQRRDSFLSKAKTLHDTAVRENRELSADEQREWDSCMANVEQLDQRRESQIALDSEIAERTRTMNSVTSTDPNFDVYGGVAGTRSSGLPNLIGPRLAAFKGPEAHRNAFDAGLWLRACVLNDGVAKQQLESRRPAWLNSMSEASPTAGGYTVPAEFSAAIIQYLEEVGVARKLATVVPCNSDSITVPKVVSGPTVYMPGEETAITPSDMSFGRVSLIPKKRAILTMVSSELNADNAIGLMDLLAQRMGHELALAEDAAYVTGNGTSTYGGVLGVHDAVVAATAGVYSFNDHDAWSELTIDDHLAAMSLLASKYRVRSQMAWLVSTPYKWQVLDRLTMAAGGALTEAYTRGITAETFLGYPVFTSDYMPTTSAVSTVGAIFGNFKMSTLMALRDGIRVATSEHYSFNTDQIAVRATVRWDVNVHEAGSTGTAGGLVGLSTYS